MTAEPPRTALDTALGGGRTLIEASAGSGKTRAITTLVARLVVEEDRALDSILIVTFTRAATAELRERVREILGKIRQGLERPDSIKGKDGAQARELLARWADAGKFDERRIGERIEAALLDMDRANVFTIHGFCQRALAEFAFETGFPFGFEVGGDETGVVASVVRDIWQRRFKDSSPIFANYLAAKNFMPAELADWFGSVRARLFEAIEGAPDLPVEPDIAEAACRQTLESLLANWREHGREYSRIVRESTAFDRRKYRKDTMEERLAAFEKVAAVGVLPVGIDGLAKLARDLGAAKASQACNPGQRLPQNPLFEAFDELARACDELLRNFADCCRRLRRQIIGEADAEIRRLARDERCLAYDDLLVEMRAALYRENAGQRLAARLRRRFPVALIDEFQDTDPTQERIFSGIYGDREDSGSGAPSGQADRRGALYIVGDPKQSIYEFRGADIFAYLAAQKESDSSLQLDRNWRSAPELVAAVNAVFAAPLAFTMPEIEFAPARPGRDDETRLEIDGEVPPPLDFWLPDDQRNNANATAVAVDAVADDIVRLLALARAGKAGVGGKALKASDIAILVNTRSQGREVAGALRRRGGKSVEVDDASVFESREAEQVHRLLRALVNPGRRDFLRAALADDVFGLDNAQLLALSEEDEAWGDWTRRFGEWRECWRSRGVGAMLRGLVDAGAGAGNLLRYADGPRRLTNLHHLTELLQEAETDNRFSPATLLAWFGRRRQGRAGPGGGAEEAALRLDNDQDLVRILTIHRSKGLEFPLVYLPFAWQSRKIGNRAGFPVSYHRRDGARFPAILDLAADASVLGRRELEEFGESVRLLYVALTRARERCVVVWTRITSKIAKELPPLAWLMHRSPRHNEMLAGLSGGEPPSTGAAVPCAVARVHDSIRKEFPDKKRAAFVADIQAVAGRCPRGIRVRELSGEIDVFVARFEPEPELEYRCRDFNRPIRGVRQMTSFTALAADHAAPAPAHRFMEAGAPDRDESAGGMTADPDARAAGRQAGACNAFNFPRGVQVGTCLHRIFEILDQHPARPIDQVCKEQLRRAGIEAKWRDVARTMVENTLATELREPGQDGFRLADIDRRLVELEFFFPVNGLRRAGLGRLLERFGYPGLLRGEDGAPAIDGYLRGFVDLAFEHAGRWHVLDYKSNWLGDKAEDYERPRLAAAMREHRYPLQYLIYLLALHRYLRTRLPDYDYQRHVGGAFYLFLRGMDPGAGMSRGVWFDRPSQACIEALDDCMRGAS